MDLVSLPPHVIQRVFDFLDPPEVYRCRCVCKCLLHEAMRWLINCPPIDACQFYAQYIKLDGYPLAVASERRFDTDNWYFKRRTNFRPLPRSEGRRSIESFLSTGMNCLQSFTFVRTYDDEHGCLSNRISFKYVTIVLDQCVNVEVELDGDQNSRTSLQTLMSIPQNSCSFDRMTTYLTPHTEAFHFNRFSTGHRVIITDWSNPESVKPNLDDPQYPVRVFIYFVVEFSDERSDILEYIGAADCPIIGGHVCVWSILYFNPSEIRGFIRPPAISIAFAGNQTKSSMHVLKNLDNTSESELIQKLIDFKNSLDFPIDDDRVIGFWFFQDPPHWKKCTIRLMKIFGSIKFVTLQMELMDPSIDPNDSLILLIRI